MARETCPAMLMITPSPAPDPASSVTNPDCRFHHVENAYAAGPALLPSIGSPNPMLTGVALARRLGDRLVPAATPPVVANLGL